ncbi:hypothetical protein [Streptacidiphilus rugosus]|uniref:hypothetical protein n=1 Tax=Streptacidiphilus rugosus TaxID=405783 RepID=UPI00056509FA|nr:hypothetical protein [Streptacidiphilus rugosus]
MYAWERFRSMVLATAWDDIEFARPRVGPEHVEALVGFYWTLEEWPQRIALVQLVQDRKEPALKPVMLDVLRAPLTSDRENVELTMAAALRIIDDRYDTFMRFYEDREALHAAVREAREAHGSPAEER